MLNKVYIVFVLTLINQFIIGQEKLKPLSACTLTIITSPSTTSTSCNGSVTSINAGTVCAPLTYTVVPGNSLTMLCPGNYTLFYQDAGCCGIISGAFNIGNLTSVATNQNPTASKLYFESASRILYITYPNKEYSINITDILGKKINSVEVENGDRVQLQNLEEGIYFISLMSQNEFVDKIKIYYH